MKKTFICILSIVFLLVGTLSVMALDDYDKSSSTKEQKNVEVKASEPTLKDVVDITSLNAQKEVVFNNLLNNTFQIILYFHKQLFTNIFLVSFKTDSPSAGPANVHSVTSVFFILYNARSSSNLFPLTMCSIGLSL